MASDSTDPPASLTSSLTRDAWRYWQGLRNGRGMPSRADIDPSAIPRLLPHVLLIDVLRDPLDFHYRLIGTYLDERLKHRYTGRRAREFEEKGPGSKIWESLCRVVEERQPCVHQLPYTGPHDNLKSAEEVILPLSDDDRTVTMTFNVVVFIERPGPAAIPPAAAMH